ncbi:hypothetical protein GCM10010266_69180 [Streptomyces griseomycini]|uniref:hypothetical protein n=1 Tax=Streptomyces griseomycini TaxID=66895 RepID=UPI001874CE17|nr:hypothetical protein [Streptomyces griseomycini]GGQ36021.1 hypothetical protein GCM10010266_69180 [Streptomyces griseomycini]
MPVESQADGDGCRPPDADGGCIAGARHHAAIFLVRREPPGKRITLTDTPSNAVTGHDSVAEDRPAQPGGCALRSRRLCRAREGPALEP